MGTISGLMFGRARRAATQKGFTGLTLVGLNGRGTYGAKQGAVFYVGRSFGIFGQLEGKHFGGHSKPLGYAIGVWGRVTGSIPARRITALALRLRKAQVGKDRASATFRFVQGFYKGIPELSTELAFIFDGSDSSLEVFTERMLSIGEELAYALAQREVFIEVQGEHGVVTHTVSPIGFPSPTEADGTVLDKFIDDALRKVGG